MMPSWRKHLVTFLVAGAGFLVAWSVWHLYVDHQSLHSVIQWINNQNTQQIQRGGGTK